MNELFLETQTNKIYTKIDILGSLVSIKKLQLLLKILQEKKTGQFH